jgi:hypothetical protein
MVTVRVVRFGVTAVCGVCIAGMIVSTILKHDGAALTFGLVIAAATLCLMTATAVLRSAPSGSGAPDEVEIASQAGRVEDLVTQVVAQGATEPSVRLLVREAVQLGRLRP